MRGECGRRFLIAFPRRRLLLLLLCRVHRGFVVISALFIEFFDGLQFLLLLHSPILEPDFDLSLREAEHVGQFNTSSASQVAVKLELFLQLQRLESRVRLSTAASLVGVRTWRKTKEMKQLNICYLN